MFSIIALGLLPFLSASQLVELVALAVPRMRALRVGGPAGRLRLYRATLLLTLVLGAVQAYFICTWLQNAGTNELGGSWLVPDAGGWFYLTTIATLVAALFLLIGIAHAISRFGVGNGFSLVIGWSTLAGLVPGTLRQLNIFGELQRPPAHALLWLALAAGVVYATARLARHMPAAPGESGGAGIVRLPTCGLIPVGVAFTLASVPGQLANLGLPIGLTADGMESGATLFLVAVLLLLVGAGYLLSRLFYRPPVVAGLLRDLGLAAPDEPALRRALAPGD
jgi:preprotein translocase subunit SecY